MNDAEYIFMQDCKEKKNIGKNMHAKKSKSKGCRLPSDNLTKKERGHLNGEARTYSMGKPMSYADFKSMPVDLQKEYILKLRRDYEAREADIAKMFGITVSSWARYKNLKLPELVIAKKGCSLKHEESLKWIAFYCGDNSNAAHTAAAVKDERPVIVQSEKPADVIASIPAVIDDVPASELMAPAQECDVLNGTLNLTGHPEDIFSKVMALLDHKKSYKINITFEG